MKTSAPRHFDSTSTAADVLAGVDLSGRSVLVTGGGSGIGRETARALASAGARVTLAVRDTAAGDRAARQVEQSEPGAAVDVRELDLSDVGSVDRLVAAWDAPLDVLIANAGVMKTPEQYTPEGWELQFATNHLWHFALATGLHDALAASGNARVVVVSSSGHDSSPVDFDDLFFARRPYDPDLAYGQSKTANVLFAVEAARRWQPEGITANALMPGGVWTDLQRHWDPDELAQAKEASAGGGQVKSVEQGAATSALLASAPELEHVSGRYFEDCHQADVVAAVTDGLHGVREHALNPVAAARLWDVSSALLAAGRRAAGAGAEAVVRRLIAAIVEGRDDLVLQLLSPDVEFVNGELGTLRGPAAVLATMRQVTTTMDDVRWDVPRISSRGGHVLAERVDNFARGGTWASIPLVGVFDVRDGQVVHWREYFDAEQGRTAMAALPDRRQ